MRTRVEETVLDLVDRAGDLDEVVAVITGACQRRLTTAARLQLSAVRRRRLRRRQLFTEVLDDVRDGVHSALERRYRVIERTHGLPAGERNVAEGTPGHHCYRDVLYRQYATVVELDGNASHPVEHREADRMRDNAVVETAQVTWSRMIGEETGRPDDHDLRRS
jgi:hypothetical protein